MNIATTPTEVKHLIVIADNPVGERFELHCTTSEAHEIARDLYGPNYSLQVKPLSDKVSLKDTK